MTTTRAPFLTRFIRGLLGYQQASSDQPDSAHQDLDLNRLRPGPETEPPPGTEEGDGDGNGRPQWGRNYALDLVRVTEGAALAASAWLGDRDTAIADAHAVKEMEKRLSYSEISGTVVVSAGAHSGQPAFRVGRRVGPPDGEDRWDIAVNPVDGVRAVAKGKDNAISVIGVAPRGSMRPLPPQTYVDKIVAGPSAAGRLDIRDSVDVNIRKLAEVKGMRPRDIFVAVLDRPRNEHLLGEIRAAGARARLLEDGDVIGALMAIRRGTGVHMLMGSGQSAAATLVACAAHCFRAMFQCRPHLREGYEEEDEAAFAACGIGVDDVLNAGDLVRGDDVYFAATGITAGALLEGVYYKPDGVVTTQSLMTRSRTGTVRINSAEHLVDVILRPANDA